MVSGKGDYDVLLENRWIEGSYVVPGISGQHHQVANAILTTGLSPKSSYMLCILNHPRILDLYSN